MRQADTTAMLQALAAFGPELRAPDATAGKWSDQKGSGTVDDPLTMPYFESSELLDRFMNMTYEVGWVQDFDWMEWSREPEAKLLMRDSEVLSDATIEQLINVITTLVRADRFSEGTLARSFESGTLRALAERAQALLLRSER
ncbi:MAG: DUF6508 domain-containing protein [Xanthobacteraceae bacterium]